ncbi:ABC transporter permease [Barrientosiimonas marina]|uniref:Oligopeptide ABC transporter permease n=1 Tax=Lentibacillus kimchii TaxID=1542911 RepID=A0ABW2V0V7_9BACI
MATNRDKDEVQKELFVPLERQEDTSEDITKPSRSFFQDARRTFFKNKLAVVSMILMAIIILMSILGPHINEFGLDDQDLSRAKMPPRVPVIEDMPILGMDGTLESEFKGDDVEEASQKAVTRYNNDEDFVDINVLSKGDGSADSAEVSASYHIYQAKDMQSEYFWLGTDRLGRDQWTRLWLGSRVSLIIAFVAAAIDLLIGVAYGAISGYFGGRVDNILQRILEIFIGIPKLVVMFLLLVLLEPGIMSIVLALTLTGWTSMARIVRGEVLKQKNEEYVMAARTLGQSNRKILSKHLLPNIIGIVIINMMFSIPDAIFFESFLSFIGLGIVPPDASLGSLINGGFKVLRLYPFMVLYPAILISAIMISFNLIGDGLRDAFDPKMHK